MLVVGVKDTDEDAVDVTEVVNVVLGHESHIAGQVARTNSPASLFCLHTCFLKTPLQRFPASASIC
jgi:hypothetical protein